MVFFVAVCQSIDIRNSVTQFSKLKGCRVVEGFVQIILIDRAEQSAYANISFPDLVEITGYLILYRYNYLQIFFSTADISSITLMRCFSTGIANGLYGSYFAYFSLAFVCSCFQGKWTEDRRTSVSESDGHSRSFSLYQLCPCGIRDDASSGNRSPFSNQHSTRIRAI